MAPCCAMVSDSFSEVRSHRGRDPPRARVCSQPSNVYTEVSMDQF